MPRIGHSEKSKCVVCTKESHGGLFCRLECFNEWEDNKKKYKNNQRLKEVIEDAKPITIMDIPSGTGYNNPNYNVCGYNYWGDYIGEGHDDFDDEWDFDPITHIRIKKKDSINSANTNDIDGDFPTEYPSELEVSIKLIEELESLHGDLAESEKAAIMAGGCPFTATDKKYDTYFSVIDVMAAKTEGDVAYNNAINKENDTKMIDTTEELEERAMDRDKREELNTVGNSVFGHLRGLLHRGRT